MSSIIVLDSSDEDENPPKKAKSSLISITPVKNSSGESIALSITQKPRLIPSGITVTTHQNSTVAPIKSLNDVTDEFSTNSLQSAFSSALGLPAVKNNVNNLERQASTSPRQQTQQHRKRKTPTPPQPRSASVKSYSHMSSSSLLSPAASATTMAPLPPLMPAISSVHSLATAGTTPPLQLLATPPRAGGGYNSLNDQLMINPLMMHTNLPPNTTITAQPSSHSQNNMNTNFKIHLPPKSASTPSPIASPSSLASKTPSPQLVTSPSPSRTEKPSRRIKPETIVKSSDEIWLQKKQKKVGAHSKSFPSLGDDVVIEMLPPTIESPKPNRTSITSPATPKSEKSLDNIILSPSTKTPGKTAAIDLSSSVEENSNPTVIIDLADSSPSVQKLNGDATVTGVPVIPERLSSDKNGNAEKLKSEQKEKPTKPKIPLEPEYEELIKLCRQIEPSDDMEKLIKTKLIKYYYEVHPDFVKSKSFRKSIRRVIEAIRTEPDLVYYNLKTIVEELKIRRKSHPIELEIEETEIKVKNDLQSEEDEVTTNMQADVMSTGNKKTDEQIRKLNKALYILTKRIKALEQAEVEWDNDDEDSTFLQMERSKKRAYQIYEKICDLTGESKNAHRLVKKPIKFNGTRIPQFNKTLQAFINRTKEFPDYFDVMRMLEHCNRTYDLGLVNFEIKNIAEDAFIKVGKLLQTRRKTELYETLNYFAGSNKDPATHDPLLAAKLNENQQNQKKINDILEKYVRQQEMPADNEEQGKGVDESMAEKPTTSKNVHVQGPKSAELVSKIIEKEALDLKIETEDDFEEEEEDDDDDEDEVNLEEHVETLANGDLSDNDSDIEIIGNTSQTSNNKKETEEQLTSAAESPKKCDIIASLEKHQQQEALVISDSAPTADENNSVNNNKENLKTANVIEVEIPDATNEQMSTGTCAPYSSASITPPNGKLKDSSNSMKLDVETATTTVFTSKSTTTADLKIVTVSSLNPQQNQAMLTGNTSITCTPAINRSLDEIVISDEES
uniref:Daxx histone-binding domain-containing protein n=1 Tax=Glossina brevipalpis TaxID=37001 RepID=A0A1A9W3Y2_9MUSC